MSQEKSQSHFHYGGTAGRPEEPVRRIGEPEDTHPIEGIALCLSGGGYRAMLYHLGVLKRFNEIGLLKELKRVSSVSGGSITAAVLGMSWNSLKAAEFSSDAFDQYVKNPVCRLASVTIDSGAAPGSGAIQSSLSLIQDFFKGHSIGRGMIHPDKTAADLVAEAYDEHLFHGKTLQDLPNDDEGPRFIFNATNVGTGSLWRFSKPYMGDWRVGLISIPNLSLARAVTASSAFPPMLSPCEIDLRSYKFNSEGRGDLYQRPFTEKAVLTDGGVYDNLGLETAWKRYRTIFVSDAGKKMEPESKPSNDWARHSFRVNSMIDDQVRSLRKRQLLASLEAEKGSPFHRYGAYWSIRTPLENYSGPEKGRDSSIPPEISEKLAKVPTRLHALPIEKQKQLFNWGYLTCEASMGANYDKLDATLR